jgi:hypothetical protein
MRRWGFQITGSIIFAAGVALALAALGADNGSPRQHPYQSEFPPTARSHVTPAAPESLPGLGGTTPVPAQSEVEPPQLVPSTRSSFMASWQRVNGAVGYRLDVSTDASFSSYVEGYHDLDVSNASGRVVTGLSSGTTYYYRVRAYDATGTTSTSSTVTTDTTVATSGLVINPTFDSSITTRTNAATIEAMINRAISIYESLFSDPMTVQIRFRYATTAPNGSRLSSSTLSETDSTAYDFPWSTFINALKADAKTENDFAANATLPATALSTNIVPSSANGRAVGLDTPPAMSANGTVGSGPYDGIVTLSSAVPWQFTRPTSSTNYDAQRSTEHEIDEVLGFSSYLGSGQRNLYPPDLFSWSSAGIRNITSSGTRYFSINRGTTNIVNFNQDSSGDLGDWLSTSCPQAHPYVQNAFGCRGQSSDVTATSPEGVNLDVIGYDLVRTPIVTTNAATNVASFSATLNGSVNPNGLTTTIHFQYGTTTSYGSTTANQTFTGNTTRNVAANISGLSASTTYHFRIVATNSAGTRFGSDRTFTALSATGAPVVTTNPATNVAISSATPNGSLDPHGLTTTVYFQYGTTTSYGHSTPMQSQTGNTFRNISANISGLSASTVYHFRIVATNSGGTRVGSDRTFTTL